MGFVAKKAIEEWSSSQDLSWLDLHEVKTSRSLTNKAVFNLKVGDLVAELAIWGDKGTYSFTVVDLAADADVLSQNGEADTIDEINEALSKALAEIRGLTRSQG